MSKESLGQRMNEIAHIWTCPNCRRDVEVRFPEFSQPRCPWCTVSKPRAHECVYRCHDCGAIGTATPSASRAAAEVYVEKGPDAILREEQAYQDAWRECEEEAIRQVAQRESVALNPEDEVVPDAGSADPLDAAMEDLSRRNIALSEAADGPGVDSPFQKPDANDAGRVCTVCKNIVRDDGRCPCSAAGFLPTVVDDVGSTAADPLVELLWLYMNLDQALKAAPEIRALLSRDSATDDGWSVVHDLLRDYTDSPGVFVESMRVAREKLRAVYDVQGVDRD